MKPLRTRRAPSVPSGQDRYHAIVAVAGKLFAERGFDAISMREVAEAAEISKANLYHYFSGKDALYLAVIAEAARELRALLDGEGVSGSSPIESIRAFLRLHLRYLLAHPQVVRIFLRELLDSDEVRAGDLARAGMADIFSLWVRTLREGQETGLLKKGLDPAVVATALLGANLIFFQSRNLLRQYGEVTFTEDPDGYTERVLELILYGAVVENAETRPCL